MKPLMAAIWCEGLKTYKTRVFWLSVAFFIFIALMISLIMYVQIHPEISEKLGIIGTKASLLRFGEPIWQNYFTLLLQTVAAIGLVGYGFVTSWVFGREYSDKTAKDILALPVSRSDIVLSKFIISAIWCFILSIVLLLFALLFGKIAGLTGWSDRIFSKFSGTFALVSFLTLLLCTPVAFFASFGRGYLVPFAFIILTLITANFIGLVGLGPFFPWAVPGILSLSSSEGNQLNITSYFILSLTSIAGYAATSAWWRFADQK